MNCGAWTGRESRFTAGGPVVTGRTGQETRPTAGRAVSRLVDPSHAEEARRYVYSDWLHTELGLHQLVERRPEGQRLHRAAGVVEIHLVRVDA